MIIGQHSVSEGMEFSADVCVVGAGAAGITTAIELARNGVSTLLLPGGSRRYCRRYQRLYRGFSPRGIPLERARLRRFGGTTTVWGGRCLPLDEIDFEKREYVPFSGWPLQAGTLTAYYARAQQYLDIGNNPSYLVSEVLPQAPPRLIEGFEDDILLTNKVEKFSLPTDFGRKYHGELARSDSVRVIMDGHLAGMSLSPEGDRVTSFSCVTGRGTRFTCRAERYVLAMGTLENTRHLLRPSEQHPSPIGNASGALGRFFMTHFSGVIAEIVINRGLAVIDRYETDADGVYCRRRLQISEQAQRRERTLNFSSFLHHTPLEDPAHRDPVLSLIFVCKGLRGVALRIPAEYSAWLAYRRFGWRDYLGHFRNIVLGLPSLVARAPGLIYKRWIRQRKLPSVIIRRKDNRFALLYHVEQAPHPESRVTLVENAVDEHGIPRLHVDLQYGDLEIESILRAHLLIRERLERAGVGTLRFLRSDPRHHIEDQFDFGGHQMGTTRMAASAQDGVVDPDCRVFGVANLYVAGPSVFPTGGQANPVATVVALAIRLADHLRAEGPCREAAGGSPVATAAPEAGVGRYRRPLRRSGRGRLVTIPGREVPK